MLLANAFTSALREPIPWVMTHDPSDGQHRCRDLPTHASTIESSSNAPTRRSTGSSPTDAPHSSLLLRNPAKI